MADLTAELNRLAGTTNLDAQGAANILASTTQVDLVKALNIAAGTTNLEFNAAVKALAVALGGNPLLDANGALSSSTPVPPLTSNFLLESGDFLLLEDGDNLLLEA